MPINVLMPALSPTMTEGNLVRWNKNPGDTIKSGDVIAEIETDKATMEVEAVDEGVLAKILIPAGSENVQVNSILAIILEDGESTDTLEIVAVTTSDVSASTTEQSKPVAETTFEPKKHHDGNRIIASPLAKRIAAEHNVSLTNVTGSGPRGRIIKDDVLEQLQNPQQHIPQSQQILQQSQPQQGEQYTEIKLNNMRKTIAARLTEAKQTIPHFYLSIECQMDNLLNLRSEVNTRNPHKTSVNDWITKAVALALQDVPESNVTWHDNIIHQHRNSDVCVAVAIDGGLITPIVPAAQDLPLIRLSKYVKDLIAKAREGKLKPHEYQGGTFTISNLGMYGVDNFGAIINPPQGAILAVGKSTPMPVIQNGEIVVANIMKCTLSVDHRMIDGAVGASFLQAFKGYLEDPFKILI